MHWEHAKTRVGRLWVATLPSELIDVEGNIASVLAESMDRHENENDKRLLRCMKRKDEGECRAAQK